MPIFYVFNLTTHIKINIIEQVFAIGGIVFYETRCDSLYYRKQ